MKTIITNAFSLNMLETRRLFPTTITVQEIDLELAQKIARGDVESAVGHTDTARIFSELLGVEIPMARKTVQLREGCLLVGQYSGPRLPEGATELPQGATIKWLFVGITSPRTSKEVEGNTGG